MDKHESFEQEDDLTTLEVIGFGTVLLIVSVVTKVERIVKAIFGKRP